MTILTRLEQWKEQGTISPEQHAHLAGRSRGEPFSICRELNVLLYAGVLAFVAGLGFVDKLMPLMRECGWVPEGESDVEIALREVLANAIIHGNHENPRKHVHVRFRCKRDEVSIAVKDEGQGTDINRMPDPTAPDNVGSVHGRGIYLMKTLMDDVRFEEGGVVVRMRRSASPAAAKMRRRTRFSKLFSSDDSISIFRASVKREDLCLPLFKPLRSNNCRHNRCQPEIRAS